jgi:hypothetical protein
MPLVFMNSHSLSSLALLNVADVQVECIDQNIVECEIIPCDYIKKFHRFTRFMVERQHVNIGVAFTLQTSRMIWADLSMPLPDMNLEMYSNLNN